MDISTPVRDGVAHSRSVAFKVVAGAIALTGGGAGLSLFLGAGSSERMVHRLHDIGPALVLLLVLAFGGLAAAVGDGRSVATVQQMLAGAVALGAATVISGRQDPVVLMIVVLVAALVTVHPQPLRLVRRGRPSRPLSVIALLGSIPLLWFAVQQATLQRSAVMDAHGVEAHYAGMAAMALSFALVAFIASLRSDGWRLSGWVAALGVGAYSVASLATPRLPGSFGSVGAVLALVGSFILLVAVEVEARSERMASGAPTPLEMDAPGAS